MSSYIQIHKDGHRSVIQLFHEDPDLRIEDLKIE